MIKIDKSRILYFAQDKMLEKQSSNCEHFVFCFVVRSVAKSRPTPCNSNDCSHEIKRCLRRSQDGGGVGRGEHFLPHKFFKRTFKRRVNSTKQLLIASRGHQAPRKATQVSKGGREKYKRPKKGTKEGGKEFRPGRES